MAASAGIGFACGCFAGSLKVFGQLGSLAIAATGGFAVWLLSVYLQPNISSQPDRPSTAGHSANELRQVLLDRYADDAWAETGVTLDGPYGIRVSEDAEVIVLRRPNMADTRIAQRDVKRAAFTKSSMMPEGLLDGLAPEQVTDLFAYLKTLK